MKIKKVTLEGDRLVLRPYSSKNAKELSEIEVRFGGKVNTVAKALKWIRTSWIEDSCYFGIFLKETKKLIGNAELCHMSWWYNHAGEVCYMIDKDYRKKGYATEASKIIIDFCFKRLGFHKMYADTDPDNKASQKVLKKLGFKLEGISREKGIVNGKWTNELNFGLLKREWKK